MLSTIRRFLKKFHPEGIPGPGTLLYNAISRTIVFQYNYELLAADILSCCSQNSSILDIGTGPGRLLMVLHRLCPTLKLTGMDVSPSMVTKARENMAKAELAGAIDIKQCNVSDMPFPDGSFDTVVSTWSLHHWKDPTAGLNEIYRVLRPDGCALIYDLVSDTPASILKETAHKFGRFRVILLWIHAFEEPFYKWTDMELLARPTLFKHGQSGFVGISCRLILKKTVCI